MQGGVACYEGSEALGLEIFFGFHFDGDDLVAMLDEEVNLAS